MTMRAFLSVLVAAGVLSSAGAAVYHVSPAGCDTNAGTEALPWLTVQKAASSVAPGDTVLIRNGQYKEHVVITRSGAPGKPITFANYPGHAPEINAAQDLPADDLSQPPRRRGLGRFSTVQLFNVTNVHVRGLKLANGSVSGFYAQNCDSISVRECHIHDTMSSGIKIIKCTNVIIDNNEIERACLRSAEEAITVKIFSEHVQVSSNHVHHSDTEGIDIKEGSRNVCVFGNHVHDMRRQGLYTDAWNVPTFNVSFYDNIVHDCAMGITVGAETGGLLSNVWVFNNVVYNCKWPGLIVAGWGDRANIGPMLDIRFVNNTIHNCGGSDEWNGALSFETGMASNVLVRNNIFSRCAPPLIAVKQAAAAVTIDHNLFFGESSVKGTAFVEGDPKFVNAAAGDFRLLPGSPAIGKGSSAGAPRTDSDGVVRPDGHCDIGAFQAAPTSTGATAPQ